jgi:restriction endonuclease S subunit
MSAATATKPEIFTTWSDEVLKNRIDAYFYQPKFRELYEVLKRGHYKIGKLSDTFDGGLIKGILPDQDEKEGDVNVVQISNIERDGTINISECITAKLEVYDEKHVLKPSDILVVITGATIGKVGFWQEEKPGFYLGGDVVKFQVNRDFDPVFVWAYLRSEFGQKQIMRHITGATNKHLAPDDIANIQIPLLSLDKQHKLAGIVQTAYAEKRKKEEEIKKILASIDDYVLGELGIEIPERGGRTGL